MSCGVRDGGRIGIEFGRYIPRVFELHRQRFLRHLRVRSDFFFEKSRFFSGFPSAGKRAGWLASKINRIRCVESGCEKPANKKEQLLFV